MIPGLAHRHPSRGRRPPHLLALVATLALLVLGCQSPSGGAPSAKPQAAGPPAAAPQAASAPTAAPQPAAQAAPAREKATFRLDWVASGYHAPFFLALARGYYTDQGLDLEIGDGRGSTTTVRVVGAGTDTFGMASQATVALAIAEGVPVRAIAGIIQKMPEGIISLQETGITTPKDVEGRTMAYTPGSSGELLFPAFAAATGIDESRVAQVNVDAGAKATTVLQGRADFMADWGFTQLPIFRAQGKTGSVILYADSGVNVLGHGLFAGLDTIRDKPEIVHRFVSASLRGLDEATKDPEAALDAMLQYRPETKRDLLLEQFKGMGAHLRTANSEGRPLGWQSPDDWRQTSELLLKYMDMKRPVPLDELYTNQFIPGS